MRNNWNCEAKCIVEKGDLENINATKDIKSPTFSSCILHYLHFHSLAQYCIQQQLTQAHLLERHLILISG